MKHQRKKTVDYLREELRKLRNPAKAEILSRFFKTGRGEYGEGDVFLGIPVALQRSIAKKYRDLHLDALRKLLSSRIHEERLVAILILISKYKKADNTDRRAVVDFYLKNTRRINNWDLVDISAGNILGDYLLDKDRTLLSHLAESDSLWERRIAIMASFAFIKRNEFGDALHISELLLRDTHDLIHKAVGWMLREIGKRDKETEEQFLRTHYRTMPRTMLRYAIERFDERTRNAYLKR
jgi:3-methyladenine DNA glycosylase AlkD